MTLCFVGTHDGGGLSDSIEARGQSVWHGKTDTVGKTSLFRVQCALLARSTYASLSQLPVTLPALALPDFPNPFGRLQVVPAHILLNHLPSVFEHLSSDVKPRTPHGASACRHIHRGASYNAALRAYARFAGLI